MSFLGKVRGFFASKPAPVPAVRTDGWVNAATGLGSIDRDKAVQAVFWRDARIDDETLASLFYHNGLAGRIVDTEPGEMLKCGFDVLIDKDEKRSKEIQKAAKKLQLRDRVLEAMIWARLYGGALLVLGLDDGVADAKLPLREDRLRAIRFAKVVDRRFVVPETVFREAGEQIGEPETYRFSNGKVVHASRVIRFDGGLIDPYESVRFADGWSYSVLQRVHTELRSFATSFQATGHLLQDASQGVFKIQNLYSQIAADPTRLATRMQLVDMCRSIARSMVLDSEQEDFERVVTSFSGIPDVLDRMMMLLAAVADVPVTRLMGRSPAGQNATGESDERHWYSGIEKKQVNWLAPKLEHAYRLLSLAKENGGVDPEEVEVNFAPLWQPTAKEQAELEKIVAEKDAVYLDREVLTPEEVAIARYGKGHFCAETEIDVEARRAAVKGAVAFDPYEADPNASATAQAEAEAAANEMKAKAGASAQPPKK